MPHLIAFKDEIADRFPCVFGEITDNAELNPVGGEFLEDLAGQAVAEVEELRRKILLMQDHHAASLEIEFAQQIEGILWGIDYDSVTLDFGKRP
jgi:hypothetical protein